MAVSILASASREPLRVHGDTGEVEHRSAIDIVPTGESFSFFDRYDEFKKEKMRTKVPCASFRYTEQEAKARRPRPDSKSGSRARKREVIVFLNHPGQVPFGAGRGSPGRGSVIVSKEASNNGNAR